MEKQRQLDQAFIDVFRTSQDSDCPSNSLSTVPKKKKSSLFSFKRPRKSKFRRNNGTVRSDGAVQEITKEELKFRNRHFQLKKSATAPRTKKEVLYNGEKYELLEDGRLSKPSPNGPLIVNPFPTWARNSGSMVVNQSAYDVKAEKSANGKRVTAKKPKKSVKPSANLVKYDNALNEKGQRIVKQLARLIHQKLAKTNLRKTGTKNEIPQRLEFDAYLERLVRFSNVNFQTAGGVTSAGVISAVHCVAYVDRMIKSSKHIPVNIENIKRFVMVGMLVASKYSQDTELTNRYWVASCCDISLGELNELEKIFCDLLDFELYISEKEYKAILHKAYSAKGPTKSDYKKSLSKNGNLCKWEVDALI
mmetsp:Transcript_9547/g.10882  ORF Transcript_9547/g.10882 Transcript_9547/m.10882 type:complete len:363 (-) Transcript_9547:96-1184(-)|eukprot:CAMPEP_0184019826 /NCGR_PEP_ID=MMETSP0954-20121128/8981_1 /TAXON_ID=627963 /ORGANISM="Aplanochytrium sp, Strain PBS07" /LENGTH=362 /DNA_ID=CAMNT_0026301563 /DNA_START=304 /DNA_END=1392 /DNA_ORIENTATION=+